MQIRQTILIPKITENKQEISRSHIYMPKLVNACAVETIKWHEDTYKTTKPIAL